LVFLLLAQSRTENVAERSTRIRRSVLCNGFLLFRDFQSLDRNAELAGLLVEDGYASVNLLANGEALWALLVAVTGQVGTLDEALDVVVDETNVEAAVLNTDDFTGDDCALAEFARSGSFTDGVTAELLDAERNALLLDVHIENLS